MKAIEQRVALMSSDPRFDLPRDVGTPLLVDRQPWRDEIGPLSANALVEQMLDGEPAVVCIGPDVPLELALAVGEIIDRERSAVGTLLVRPPSSDLWRQAARAGIRDIVDPGAVTSELVASLEVALDRTERLRASMVASMAPAGPRTKVIVILSPKGGSGKTMLSTNLAAALASAGEGDVALVDLDTIFGDVASVLGITTENTIGRLAALAPFDSTTLKVFLTRHDESGLYVLASSGAPEDGEAVDGAIAGRVIDLLMEDFRYIVVDTSAGLDERALAAIDRATDVLLLASLDVTSIRNLSKEIDALDRLKVTGPARHFVLNRADARVGIEVAEVESALGMRAAAALPSTRLVPLAMNQGRLVVLDEPDSALSQQLRGLANGFLARPVAIAGTADRRTRRFLRR